MLKEYVGAAPTTRLSAAITGTPATFVVESGTGYPTGGTAPFVVTIDRGTATEEKILVSLRATNTFTIQTRGYDGTAVVDHADQAEVEHTLDADTIAEANSHVNDDTRDDHSQYMNADGTRHDLEARHAFGAALGTPDTPSTQKLGDTASTGTGDNPAREDHKHAMPGPITLPYTFVVSGDIAVASGDLDFINPFFVPSSAGYTVKIKSCRHKINSGTSATVKLQTDGADLTGFTGIVVTTTATTTNPSDLFLASDTRLALVVTAVSGTPKNLSFTVYLEFGSL